MRATKTDWLSTTPRLQITPLVAGDAPVMAALGNDVAVSRNLHSVASPFSENQARRLIERRKYHGQIGFWLAVRLADGTLIGAIGFGGKPLGIGYWFGRVYWGQGFATEALMQFLNDATGHFSVDRVEAEVFEDNPASIRVMEKLGFRSVGTGIGTSPARLEESPVIKYRLSACDLPAVDRMI